MKTRTRVAGLLLGALFGCVLMAAGWLGMSTLPVAVGYKAKVLCSGVFVSTLEEDAVLAELHADDLTILKYIGHSIDVGAKSVTASLGPTARRAVYREELGCTLVLGGQTPPDFPRSIRGGSVGATARGAHQTDTTWLEQLANTTAGHKQSDALQFVVAQAFAETDPRRRKRTVAIVVVHNGRIIAEQYAPGIGPTTPLPGWSMTKSVTNALAGILVHNGRLMLDEPVPIPEWQRPEDSRRAITLDHLLRMSSGLRFDEGMSNPRSDVIRMLFAAGDVGAFAVLREQAFAPGTQWQYASGTTNIITRAIRDALRDQAEYLAFPRKELFDRIGMSSAIMETAAAGTFVGSSYMYATTRDWARFGALYLQDGIWGGARILPEGWVAYSTTPAPADSSGRYGAHFWLEVPEEYAGSDPRLPTFAFHAAGHEGQFITIVPSRNLIIVRLGRTRYPDAWDHPAFVRSVLNAIPHSNERQCAPFGTRTPTITALCSLRFRRQHVCSMQVAVTAFCARS